MHPQVCRRVPPRPASGCMPRDGAFRSAAGLDCISPEVNRNRNIGEIGANMERGFFKKYLAGMAFNTERVSSSLGLDLGFRGLTP